MVRVQLAFTLSPEEKKKLDLWCINHRITKTKLLKEFINKLDDKIELEEEKSGEEFKWGSE